MPEVPISEAALGLVEALLIGLLIGAEREAQKDKSQAGLRDFLLVALTGGICGLLQQPWLTVAALLSITIMLSVYYLRCETRTGITTEMAAVATFCVALMASAPGNPAASKLAIAAAVVMVAFLGAKSALHRFVRKTITETEFNDTLWFLAIIFVILPLLPEGRFGPYGAFEPRKIWFFVILVSSISYVGYFFQKFLGSGTGLKLTAVLGGLASTTAATLAFARELKEKPDEMRNYWYAAVLANAIQFPRLLVILWVVNADLALAALPVFLAMTIAGLLMGFFLSSRLDPKAAEEQVNAGNPFRLAPALQFGAIFAVIIFVSEAATTEFGGEGLHVASALGGAIDADAVSLSVASVQQQGTVDMQTALWDLLLALFMNALLKTGLAGYAGGRSFALRVAAGFAVMFGAGAATALLAAGMG